MRLLGSKIVAQTIAGRHEHSQSAPRDSAPSRISSATGARPPSLITPDAASPCQGSFQAVPSHTAALEASVTAGVVSCWNPTWVSGSVAGHQGCGGQFNTRLCRLVMRRENFLRRCGQRVILLGPQQAQHHSRLFTGGARRCREASMVTHCCRQAVAANPVDWTVANCVKGSCRAKLLVLERTASVSCFLRSILCYSCLMAACLRASTG